MPTNHAPAAKRYGTFPWGRVKPRARQTCAVLHYGKREGGKHERAFQQREQHDGRRYPEHLPTLEGQRIAFFASEA